MDPCETPPHPHPTPPPLRIMSSSSIENVTTTANRDAHRITGEEVADRVAFTTALRQGTYAKGNSPRHTLWGAWFFGHQGHGPSNIRIPVQQATN